MRTSSEKRNTISVKGVIWNDMRIILQTGSPDFFLQSYGFFSMFGNRIYTRPVVLLMLSNDGPTASVRIGIQLVSVLEQVKGSMNFRQDHTGVGPPSCPPSGIAEVGTTKCTELQAGRLKEQISALTF